jgi:hypothetical protein
LQCPVGHPELTCKQIGFACCSEYLCWYNIIGTSDDGVGRYRYLKYKCRVTDSETPGGSRVRTELCVGFHDRLCICRYKATLPSIVYTAPVVLEFAVEHGTSASLKDSSQITRKLQSRVNKSGITAKTSPGFFPDAINTCHLGR